MQEDNYRLVLKHVKLAILIVKLTQGILTLLNMAFNYSKPNFYDMPPHERWNSKFKLKEGVWVFVPTIETVANGLSIKKLIEEEWQPPKYYFHLQQGGHVSALRSHLANKYFIHLDIQDFFGHINKSRVTRSLKKYLSYITAREVAVASTVRLPESTEAKYILPFGFVQSPIIASVCLSESALGHHISRLSQKTNFTISVYMDDILISGNDLEELKIQLALINDSAEKSGFPLNSKKQEGPCESVTAFNVQLTQGLLKITPSRLNDFATAYTLSTNEHQRKGILNYVLSVNPRQADIFSVI